MVQVVAAYVEFRSKRSLEELAALISSQLFAGVPFVGLDEGLWDEVPAVRLARTILGLSVELGGYSPSFSLEVEVLEFPWRLVDESGSSHERLDLSRYVAFLLAQIDGVEAPRPTVVVSVGS
jgi:hypothetical protein